MEKKYKELYMGRHSVVPILTSGAVRRYHRSDRGELHATTQVIKVLVCLCEFVV